MDIHWRRNYDQELLDLISKHKVDALVFAGLLFVVGDDVVNNFVSLNLHPAAPNGPVGTWPEVIGSLIRHNAAETGVSIQLATPELDKGPVVAFSRFPVRGTVYEQLQQESMEKWARVYDEARNFAAHDLRTTSGSEGLHQFWLGFMAGLTGSVNPERDPLIAKIREEGLRREPLTLVEALRQFANGNVRIEDDRVVRDAEGQPLENGLDITQQIEDLLAEQPNR